MESFESWFFEHFDFFQWYSSRLAWAILYQRFFDIDPLECSACGGRMRFADVNDDVGWARSELRRRNLPDEPPPLP